MSKIEMLSVWLSWIIGYLEPSEIVQISILYMVPNVLFYPIL